MNSSTVPHYRTFFGTSPDGEVAGAGRFWAAPDGEVAPAAVAADDVDDEASWEDDTSSSRGGIVPGEGERERVPSLCKGIVGIDRVRTDCN